MNRRDLFRALGAALVGSQMPMPAVAKPVKATVTTATFRATFEGSPIVYEFVNIPPHNFVGVSHVALTNNNGVRTEFHGV